MLIPPGEGRSLVGGPTTPTIKIGPHLGAERLGVLESELPPGGAFPPHTHVGHEEAFYVLSGEIEYLVDGKWEVARAGCAVFVPAGRPHGFRNRTGEPARHLAIASPADAMTMIEQLFATTPDQHGRVLAAFNSSFLESDRGPAETC